MKRNMPHIYVAVALVLVSTFLPAAPASSTEGRETPRTVVRAEVGWLDSAFAWVNSLLDRIDRGRQHRDRNGASSTTAKSGNSGTSGSCIDPLGRPRPCD